MNTQTRSAQAGIRLRKPTRNDGARVHALVLASAGLEANTRYAYLLLASHFRDTCVVAERDGELVGFVGAYRIPRRPETLFVWQIGVASSARRLGLGHRMLRTLLRRLARDGVRSLEATVAQGNVPSARLFESIARELGTTCTHARGFMRSDFGDEPHEDEVLFRIGPWEGVDQRARASASGPRDPNGKEKQA